MSDAVGAARLLGDVPLAGPAADGTASAVGTVLAVGTAPVAVGEVVPLSGASVGGSPPGDDGAPCAPCGLLDVAGLPAATAPAGIGWGAAGTSAAGELDPVAARPALGDVGEHPAADSITVAAAVATAPRHHRRPIP
jgi:hypothetical protein